MSVIELLEKMGADASANTGAARDQFWSMSEMTEEQLKYNKLWCLVVPEKEDDDEDGEEDNKIVLN
ncbi:hypothetical protein OPS25_04785 [Alteromonas ponticola]|uniref:Uncharacterized protein n=1 Tax=Alteromonas aquimaris TaxID=2998417 RepID=A0ABT3P4X1_9ALTE|nr:hypothetical protein [Alteromonas aquimaris]MCW8107814.1 hypothetical protein [Alteromonas aquimaris]